MAKNRAKPPISSHGLFPVIVAIWFAALFGLGCLVLPTILLERVSQASGIATLVPAAAPPLGITARIAISSAAGVFGALLGFVIARRVAEAQADARPANLDRRMRFAEERSDEDIRRPISAKEELGNARLDAPAEEGAAERVATPVPLPMPGRRRPLAMAEESGPSQFLQQPAPLPGEPERWADGHPMMPSAMAIAARAMAQHGHGPAQASAEPAEEREAGPFELQEVAEDQGMAALKNQPIAAAAAPEEGEAAEPEPAMHPAFASPETSYAQIQPAQPPVAQDSAPAQAAEPAPQPDAPPPFAPPEHTASSPATPPAPPAQEQLAPQPDLPVPDGDVALPFARPAEPAPAQAASESDEALPFVAPSQVKQAPAEQVRAPSRPDRSAAEPLKALLAGHAVPTDAVGGPLEQLGMVELAERLARSMHRRADGAAPAQPAASPAEPPAQTQAQASVQAPAQDEDLAPAAPVAQAAGPEHDRQPEMPAAPAGQPPAFDAPQDASGPRDDFMSQGDFAPPPPVVPAALRPFTLELEEFGEEEEDDDFVSSFSLPFRENAPSSSQPAAQFGQPAAAAEEQAGDEDEDGFEEEIPTEGYSSLLAMKNPLRAPAEFVRVDMPEPEPDAGAEPAVVFPGQNAKITDSGAAPKPPATPPASEPEATEAAPGAPAASNGAPRPFDAPADEAEQLPRRTVKADPAETERALRSALATLQRMSGAA